MIWLEGLREELQRRQAATDPQVGAVDRPQATTTTDEAAARVDRLMRTLYNQMNETLLGGRGSVWATPGAWGVYIWELWWEPTRERGPYLIAVLLRDSRGTPYLKVQGRRLSLADARFEGRLRRALRAAFLAPRVYTSEGPEPAGAHMLPPPASLGNGHLGNGLSDSQLDTMSSQPCAASGNPAADTGGRSGRRHRHGHSNGRDDA
jgi:hypothetical protein